MRPLKVGSQDLITSAGTIVYNNFIHFTQEVMKS